MNSNRENFQSDWSKVYNHVAGVKEVMTVVSLKLDASDQYNQRETECLQSIIETLNQKVSELRFTLNLFDETLASFEQRKH